MSTIATASGVDQDILKDFKDRESDLVGTFSTLQGNYTKYVDMYMMNYNDAPTDDGVIVTISPDPRDKILGAKRLLTLTVPKPSVKGYRIENADALERAASTILTYSSQAAGAPLQDTAAESALLFGQVHVCISSTKALAAIASPNNKANAEYYAERTPYLLSIWDPRDGYPEWGSYGLTGYLRKVKMTVAQIDSSYGTLAADFVAGKKRTDTYEVSVFYDNVNWAVYVDDTAFVAGPHKLPSIPVVVGLVDGSLLFKEPHEKVQPFLYGYEKSGMWKRQNLALTVLYTNIFNIGINPLFVHEAPAGSPDKKLSFDASKAAGVLDLENGEKFYPMATKGIIDQSFTIGLDIANKVAEQTTIYQQALGEPPNAANTFSTDSMMSQLGRLPLAPIQRRIETSFGEALELSLRWYSKEGDLEDWDIQAKQVPTKFTMTCKVDVEVQHDKVQMFNAAGIALDKGIADRAWVRQNLMNIELTSDMDESIAKDRFFEAMLKAYIEAMVPVMVQMLIKQNPNAQTNPDLKTPNGVSNGTNGQAAPAPGLGPDQVRPPDMNLPQAVPAGIIEGDTMNPAAGGMPQVQAGTNLQQLQ